VWTCSKEDAQELLDQSHTAFESELQTAFGYWLGKIKLASQRQGFPLKLVKSRAMTDDRVVLIGNAMHQIHPVAGQGFNLGLRDAAVLAEWIKSAGELKMDIGDSSWLSGYSESRKKDLNQVIYFTDGLVRLFSNDSKPLALFRNMGLIAIDRIPSIKRILAKHAMGYGLRV
jgi:2-octaprenyl-6-methoxyphenol hydroxylase